MLKKLISTGMIQEKIFFFEFSPVSRCLCPKHTKFCFQKLGIVREDKNGRIWTTFGFNNETKISVYFAK